MKNIFNKIFIIVLSLALNACAPKDQVTKIRIVNLEGKYHPIATRMPELNAKILSSQEALMEEKKKIAENAKKESKSPAKKDLAKKEAEAPLVAVEPDVSVVALESTTPEPVPQVLKDSKGDVVEEYDISESDAKMAPPKIKKPIFIKKDKGKKGKLLISKNTEMPAAAVASASAGATTAIKKGIFVQVGSFSDITNAEHNLNLMKKFHKGFVETVEGEKTIYRTLLGPFPDKKKANIVVNKIKASGHDAIVVRNR